MVLPRSLSFLNRTIISLADLLSNAPVGSSAIRTLEDKTTAALTAPAAADLPKAGKEGDHRHRPDQRCATSSLLSLGGPVGALLRTSEGVRYFVGRSAGRAD